MESFVFSSVLYSSRLISLKFQLTVSIKKGSADEIAQLCDFINWNLIE